eukprot:261386-Chlamydomonas_euryale.AAC.2
MAGVRRADVKAVACIGTAAAALQQRATHAGKCAGADACACCVVERRAAAEPSHLSPPRPHGRDPHTLAWCGDTQGPHTLAAPGVSADWSVQAALARHADLARRRQRIRALAPGAMGSCQLPAEVAAATGTATAGPRIDVHVAQSAMQLPMQLQLLRRGAVAAPAAAAAAAAAAALARPVAGVARVAAAGRPAWMRRHSGAAGLVR